MGKKKPNGYWKDPKNILSEVRIFLEENPDFNTLPGEDVLRSRGYSSLGRAISTYYSGSFGKIRSDLGLEEKKYLKRGTWKDIDFVFSEARRIMQQFSLKIFPDNRTLEELGYSSLGVAITKYHGGFRNFRKTLGERQIQRERGIWKDLDFTISQAKEIMAKERCERLPTHGQLVELGYNALATAINHYHGYPTVRIALGEKSLDERQLRTFLEEYIGEQNE